MLGADMAYVSAKSGIEGLLLDTTQDAAEKGNAYATGLIDKDLKKARITVEGKEQLLARIKATTVYDDLKGCDLIIEAVFEDRTVKADVTRKAEAVLAKTAIFASNTSTDRKSVV